MDQLAATLITLIFLCTITAIILFGDLPNFKNSYVAIIRRSLITFWDAGMRSLKRFDDKFCNGMLYITFGIKLYKSYLWFPPLMYLVLVSIFLYQFFKYSYPQLVDPRIYLISFSLAFNVYAFIMGILLDPGKITTTLSSTSSSSKLMRKFPYNEIIFFNHSLYNRTLKNYCSTCHTLKFPRSKHCSICGSCFILFDHHCIWLNNCVGYNNYRYFISFLLSLNWIFLYGGYLNYQVLSLLEQDNGLNFFQRWFQLIKNTSIVNERAGIILVTCMLLAPVVIWFTIEHFQYLYLGMTTNESAKWDFIRFLVDNDMLYRYDDTVFLIRDSDDLFYRLSDENLSFNVLPDDVRLHKIEDMGQELSNIYDLGFYNNLRQRLLPDPI